MRYLLRGGSFYDVAWGLRSSFRYGYEPEYRGWYDGFRLVVRRKA